MLTVSAYLPKPGFRGTRRPHAAGDLRAPRGATDGRRRARAGAAGEPAGSLTAPAGAQGRGPRRRPARGQPAHLSTESGGSRRSALVPRRLLEPILGGLQGGRRERRRGSMSLQAQDTVVRASVEVEAPIERAFSVFTEDIG